MITRSSRPPLDARRQRYALLLDSIEHEYEQSVLLGALSAARALDARLVVVPGGAVDAPDPRHRADNFAFDLVQPNNVLGVLALSSVLANAIGPARLETWLARYADTPVCCIGVPIPGHVSVSVDNASGIREAVCHLIEVHGKRNIGFVRGPAQSEEAELRFAAYRETLEQHGITPDPRWLAEGDYNRSSGALAVRAILDHNRVNVRTLDALVCANDYMALGALDELSRRGISVPEQLALIGFDDVASAAAARPPLSSVRQPGGDLGREGLKQLLMLSAGTAPAQNRVLPVELKLRRSCGCTNIEVGLAERVQAVTSAASFEATLIQRRQLIVAELARAAHGSFRAGGVDWESALVNALLEELGDEQRGALGRRVQRLLQKLEDGGSELAAAPLVLATLRRQALACVGPNADARARLEDALADAQQLATFMLSQLAARSVRAGLTRFKAFARDLRESMFDAPAAVSRALAEHLPALGIDACVVAALAGKSADGWRGEICYGFAPGQGHPQAQTLPLARLCDHELLAQRRTLFLLPITLGAEPLGAAVVSVVSPQASSELLDDLREQLAVALKLVHRTHA